MSKEELSALAKDLNCQKTRVFGDLQSGRTLVPDDLNTSHGKDASTDTTSQLYQFVEGIFTAS